jgi:glycosyltransferase A (GT-A) superfamily protein (DUF2064 family)
MRSVVARLRTSTVSVIGLRDLRGSAVEVDPTWDIDTPEDLQDLQDMLGEGPTDH